MTSSKTIGNTFENKIARELGLWLFNDKDFLSRTVTSGAKKIENCNGDIIPQKQFQPNHIFTQWIFNIECKTGYKNIKGFIQKLKFITTITEKTFNIQPNNIAISIFNFSDGHHIVFCTSMLLNVPIYSSFNINNGLIFYIYSLKEVLSIDKIKFIDTATNHWRELNDIK